MNAILPKADFNIELVQGSVKKAVAAVEGKSGDLWMVPPAALRIIPGFNIRVTGTDQWNEKIKALSESMLEEGFYKDKPFTAYVQKDGDENLFYLTDGHRRYEALQIALAADPTRFELVPVLVKPPGQSLEDLTVALTKTGEALTPYELSFAVKRLLQNGAMDEATVAKRLQITRHYVDDLLLLQGAPAAVRKFVLDGTVSATLVINELRKDPKGLADRLKTAHANAKAEGRVKVTAKNMPTAAREPAAAPKEGAAPPAVRPGKKPNPNNRTIEFVGLAGGEYPLSQIAEISKLGDGDWYRLHEEKTGIIVLLQDVNIKATIKKKPAPPGQEVTNDDAADL